MVKLVDKKRILLGAYGFRGEECHGVIENSYRPESGGIYLKLLGCNYLWKSDPKFHVMNAVAAVKKIFPTIAKLIESRTIKIFVVFMFFFQKKTFLKCIDLGFRLVGAPFWDYRLKPERYCVSVREIHRVFDITIKNLEGNIKSIIIMLRDIVSMILETDFAYRTRLQDILVEIDKKKLRENPVKEIKRVFNILSEREQIAIGLKEKWQKIEKVVLLMKFSKKIRDAVVDFICELDFEKIKLDEADWFFCLNRPDYNFRGVSYKERIKERDEIYKKEGKPTIINVKDGSISG